MNEDSHDLLLGAYSMGVLDADEARDVERHLSACAACRQELAELSAVRDLLGEVPPEAFLDGPPDDGELVLRRALRQADDEGAPRSRKRGPLLVAAVAAAVVGLAGLGVGILIGDQREPAPPVARPPAATPSVPPGARTVAAANPAIGATMRATLVPADGWVRVSVSMKGVAPGTKCRILVVAKDGSAHQAGSWRMSSTGVAADVAGSALVAPPDVAAVEVDTLDGKRLVTAQF